MTYTLFFIPDYISFKKYFYVSLGNNFFTVFLEAPGQLPSLPLPLNPDVASSANETTPHARRLFLTPTRS